MGCECVYASEIKEDLRKLYAKNHIVNGEIVGDITQVADFKKIPDHDILCAGFPCQPFSQAGNREGFDDKKGRGNLFNYICKIIEEKNPKYLFLENVSNLRSHDNGNTWKVIKERLFNLGYDVQPDILSPHQFGIPQHRKRIYIVGIKFNKGGLKGFHFPKPTNQECSFKDIIDNDETNIHPLALRTIQQLNVWQEFLDECKKHGTKVPTFPIWAMEFGATYPFENLAPSFNTFENIVGKKGKLGHTIIASTLSECISQLPIYSQTAKDKVFPSWKIRYIQQNREFYKQNKEWLDDWLKKIENYDNSFMKFEWNVGASAPLIIRDNIVQFRASGIRIKAPNFSPALNLVGCQIPIVPWVKLPKKSIPKYSKSEMEEYGVTPEDLKYGRYITTKEAAKLQGMEGLSFDDLKVTRIYEALGNAVNTKIVELIATALLSC